MNYAAAVKDTWCHAELGHARHDYRALVRYATLAASSHNTQPWKFRLQAQRVTILPDMARRCPEVDADNHHLYASLGCAAENLLLAAQAAGLTGDCSYEAATGSLRIDLEESSAVRSPLFEAIPERQCSRAEYDGSSLSVEELHRLDVAARGQGVSLILLTNSRQKAEVAEYVAAGNRAQFGDARWASEMREWIRFNARDAVRTGDGLYGAVLGIPNVPRWLGRRMMRLAVSADGQSRKDARHIRSSAAIAVVFSEADDERHWIEAGRCYERLALQAVGMGLRTAFINQPVEVPALRAQLASFLGLGGRRPDLIVRIGRGPQMPRSLRRPVEQVLVRDER